MSPLIPAPGPGGTRLSGHGLIGEAGPGFRSNGMAQCECGALSAPGISQAAARRWMREHKDIVRAVRLALTDESTN